MSVFDLGIDEDMKVRAAIRAGNESIIRQVLAVVEQETGEKPDDNFVKALGAAIALVSTAFRRIYDAKNEEQNPLYPVEN